MARVALLSTTVATPIAIALGGVSAGCGLTAASCKFVERKLQGKIRKHDEVRTLAESKLNSVSDLISKALDNNEVSDGELQTILAEQAKYHRMKKSIRDSCRKANTKIKFEVTPSEKKELAKMLLLRKDGNLS